MLSRLFGKSEAELPTWPSISKLEMMFRNVGTKDACLRSLFSMLSHIVAADGDSLRSCHEDLTAFCRNSLKLSKNEELLATSVFLRAAREGYSLDDAASDFYALFSGQPKILRCMADTLVHFAHFGSGYSEQKRHLVNSARKAFGLSTDEFRSIRQKREVQVSQEKQQEEDQIQAARSSQQKLRELYKSSTLTEIERAYQTLGISSLDTVETIRSVYQQLVVRYHPDRVLHHLTQQDERDAAKQHFQELLRAYRIIMKDRAHGS